jgi:hypothetical protein
MARVEVDRVLQTARKLAAAGEAEECQDRHKVPSERFGILRYFVGYLRLKLAFLLPLLSKHANFLTGTLCGYLAFFLSKLPLLSKNAIWHPSR